MKQLGRPRSADADRAIIDAVLEGIIESGIDGLSIEQVAARAGVAKATVYRRWANKEALVLDALVTVTDGIPELLGESVRDDLVALIESMRKRGANALASGLYPHMIAEGTRHPEIAARYHRVCIETRRERARGVIRRGIATGELRADLDVETMLLLIVAPMLVHTHLWSPGEELPEGTAALYVDAVLNGLRPRVTAEPQGS